MLRTIGCAPSDSGGIRSAGAPRQGLITRVLTVIFLLLASSAASPGQRLVIEPGNIRVGETVTVFGFGFCGEPECPPVTISLGEETVIDRVMPDREGRFAVDLHASAEPGSYLVTAVQPLSRNERGELRSYSALNIVVSEEGLEEPQERSD